MPLIDHALGLDRTLSFTKQPLLAKITAKQLESLLKLHPDLRAKVSFTLAFLALPRARHELLKVPQTADPAAVRLDQDFFSATACPPVSNDLSLIESYLQDFLGATDPAAEFAAFIPEKLLNPLHARTRLIAEADSVR